MKLCNKQLQNTPKCYKNQGKSGKTGYERHGIRVRNGKFVHRFLVVERAGSRRKFDDGEGMLLRADEIKVAVHRFNDETDMSMVWKRVKRRK